MANSEADICNRALQILGGRFITSLTQDLKEARHCNVAYASALKAELRKYAWNFAKRRKVLAALAETPEFGFKHKYKLPTDYVRITPAFKHYMSELGITFEIEGNELLTDYNGALDFNYISDDRAISVFDPIFVDVLAARIALDIAEPLTSSNTKEAKAAAKYQDAMKEARRANAFERESTHRPEESSWVNARRS